MTSKNAQTLVENINNSFDGSDVTAWEEDGDLVIRAGYADEGSETFRVSTESEGLAVFHLIYAAKEQGLKDASKSLL